MRRTNRRLSLFAAGCAWAFSCAVSDVRALENVNVARPVPPIIGERGDGDRLFARSIEELPLMKGLEVVRDDEILFIFMDERISQATAKGKVDIDSVYYFYQEHLPSLGWKEVSARLYERGGERLSIEASSANAEGATFVRFAVEPIK